MAWEKTNAAGADFFRGSPNDLKPVTIVAQALDNQWVPNGLLKSILSEGNALKHVTHERDKFVRREFLRSLLNAENVVANRAYLYNNQSVSNFYMRSGEEKEAFCEMLGSRVIIPYLYTEKCPHEKVPASFDHDPAVFEQWQAVCEASHPSSLRLAWPDESGEDRENLDLIRTHLMRPFHSYGVTFSTGEADLYASHLRIPASHISAFREKLDEAAGWFFRAPRTQDGSPGFRQRNEFYQEFVVQKGRPVNEGWYDRQKPFASELKRLIDLKYNTNLADAIGKFALTPSDSLPRLALQEERVMHRQSRTSVDAEALTVLLRKILADLVQRRLDMPFLDSVSIQDVLAVRDSSQWKEYISGFSQLLDTASSWTTGGVPYMAINEHLGKVFQHYAGLTQLLADTLKRRHHESVRKGFEISYGVALSVLGQVVALIHPVGGIIFSALAEAVKPHLPVGQPAQVVCKLFFKDPTQSDVLELEADMLECRLPNAREEFDKLIKDLISAGFQEDRRTSQGAEEAKINIGSAA